MLIEDETTKKTDKDESSIHDSSAERNKQITPPPPPPPPPPPKISDSDFDMGHGSADIPLYEGDEDPRRHWFVCESTWEANQVTDEDKQMAQFVGALRKRELTWYMKFSERQPRLTKS